MLRCDHPSGDCILASEHEQKDKLIKRYETAFFEAIRLWNHGDGGYEMRKLLEEALEDKKENNNDTTN